MEIIKYSYTSESIKRIGSLFDFIKFFLISNIFHYLWIIWDRSWMIRWHLHQRLNYIIISFRKYLLNFSYNLYILDFIIRMKQYKRCYMILVKTIPEKNEKEEIVYVLAFGGKDVISKGEKISVLFGFLERTVLKHRRKSNIFYYLWIL